MKLKVPWILDYYYVIDNDVSKDQELSLANVQISKQRQELAEKDKLIKSQQNLLCQQEHKIVRQKLELCHQETTIGELKDRLLENGKHISSQDAADPHAL